MMMTDPYEQGYRDGESSGYADWRIALGEVLPDGVEPWPTSVADYIERYQDLLRSIWLYVNWRYVTTQLTTEQKELWADAVDAIGEDDDLRVDRWWREDT
jgi:hypothetical protein